VFDESRYRTLVERSPADCQNSNGYFPLYRRPTAGPLP
jgi:hypothetical protein